MERHARIADRMARQHGLISTDQLAEVGAGRSYVQTKLRRREWVHVRPTVFAIAGMPPTRAQALMAAVLCIGADALASHLSAGVLWGMRHLEAEAVEISTTLERRVDLPGVVGHRSCLLFDEDRSRCQGIPVTSRARTIIDLSGLFGATELGVIVDDALRSGLRLDDVRRCIGRLPPAPGRRPSVIHRVLAKRLKGFDPGDSDLETRVLRWLVAAGLPVPRQQFRVRTNGRTYRLDLAYPELRIAIELDGWEFHGSRTAFDADRARLTALAAAGWTVLVFTSHSTAEQIVAAVQAAAHRIGGFRAA